MRPFSLIDEFIERHAFEHTAEELAHILGIDAELIKSRAKANDISLIGPERMSLQEAERHAAVRAAERITGQKRTHFQIAPNVPRGRNPSYDD